MIPSNRNAVDSNLIKGVAERLRYWNPRYIVLDPVMVAKSGDALLTDDAVATLRDELLPLATVITPNLPEAARLLESVDITDDEQMERLLMTFGNSKAVTAGSISKAVNMEGVDYSEDLLYDGRHMIRYRAERTMTKNTHGTGCALSSCSGNSASVFYGYSDGSQRSQAFTSRRRSFTQMNFKSEKATVLCIISMLSGIDLQTITPVYGLMNLHRLK